MLQGRAAEATAEAARETTDWTRRFALALTRWGENRRAESNAALEELIRSNADTAAYQIVQVHAFRGEADRSFEWLERALRQRDPGLITMKTDPLLDRLHADARWADHRRSDLSEDLPVSGKLAPTRNTSVHRGAVLTKTQTTQSTLNDAFGCWRGEWFESHHREAHRLAGL